MGALRMVSQVPVKGALDTHYHYDHSMGNSFYGANDVPLWAHATAAQRMAITIVPWQRADKEAALGPFREARQGRQVGCGAARTHRVT